MLNCSCKELLQKIFELKEIRKIALQFTQNDLQGVLVDAFIDVLKSVHPGSYMKSVNKKIDDMTVGTVYRENILALGEKLIKALEKIGINLDNDSELPDFFTFNEYGKPTGVNSALLWQHIVRDYTLVFTKGLTDEKAPAYLYKGGVYNEISEVGIKKIALDIIAYRHPELCKTTTAQEVCQLLSNRASRISLKDMDRCHNIINFENGLLLRVQKVNKHRIQKTV